MIDRLPCPAPMRVLFQLVLGSITLAIVTWSICIYVHTDVYLVDQCVCSCLASLSRTFERPAQLASCEVGAYSRTFYILVKGVLTGVALPARHSIAESPGADRC